MTNQPPPGWQQGGSPSPQHDYSQPFGPPPDQGKKRIWPWVLGLFVLLLAMLGACAAAIVGGVFYLTRGPINATNAFIANIDDGRYEEAYESLCSNTRLAVSLEEFTTHFATDEEITGYTFTSVSTTAGDLTMVSGTIELNDSPRATSFGLQREDDTWKICTYDELL